MFGDMLWTIETVDRSLLNYRQLQGCTFKRLINIIINTASSVFNYINDSKKMKYTFFL